MLPYLVPQLVAPPVNMKALASIGPVAGDALHKHLVKIMPALIGALAAASDTLAEEETLGYAQAVVLSVSDDDDDTGLSYIMDEFFSVCGQTDQIGEKGTKLNQLPRWLVRNQILLLEQLLLHLAFPLLAYLPCRAYLHLLHSGTAW